MFSPDGSVHRLIFIMHQNITGTDFSLKGMKSIFNLMVCFGKQLQGKYSCCFCCELKCGISQFL